MWGCFLTSFLQYRPRCYVMPFWRHGEVIPELFPLAWKKSIKYLVTLCKHSQFFKIMSTNRRPLNYSLNLARASNLKIFAVVAYCGDPSALSIAPVVTNVLLNSIITAHGLVTVLVRQIKLVGFTRSDLQLMYVLQDSRTTDILYTTSFSYPFLACFSILAS